MRVILATGGTGGHIYPAMALARRIQQEEDSQILFIGSSNRMEAKILPEAGYDFMGLDVIGFNGGTDNKHNKFDSLRRIFKARKLVIEKMKEFRPDIVVGFGNYISVPVILAAAALKIPRIIHEQNSIAGMANKYLAFISDKVVISYPGSAKDFPKKKTVLLGNPRASEAAVVKPTPEALTKIGLDPEKRTVLIVMGSLGSLTVNKVLKETLKLLDGKDYQVVEVTGQKGYDDFVKDVQDTENIRILPYADQLSLMSCSDLMVSRGGATSACEIMAMGMPSIVVPSPWVPNDHQHLNALAMVEAGCALEYPEKDLTAQGLYEMIDGLMSDPAKLEEMRKNAKALGFPNAAGDITALMRDLINERK